MRGGGGTYQGRLFQWLRYSWRASSSSVKPAGHFEAYLSSGRYGGKHHGHSRGRGAADGHFGRNERGHSRALSVKLPSGSDQLQLHLAMAAAYRA